MSIVEMFADVRCPFAHVGLHRLTTQRDAVGAPFVVEPRAWPLELVNGRPLDAALIAAEVAALRRQVAPDLFRGFAAERFPASSLPALALEAAARAVDAATGERVARLLRRALFEEGRDIARPDELAAVAEAAGLPSTAGTGAAAAASVRADWEDGRRRGVLGSPHFFAAEHEFFCPTLHIGHEGDALLVDVDRLRFDDFFARCAVA